MPALKDVLRVHTMSAYDGYLLLGIARRTERFGCLPQTQAVIYIVEACNLFTEHIEVDRPVFVIFVSGLCLGNER